MTDVDDVAPSFTSSASITMNENVQDVVSLTVTDADSTAAPTYTLSGTDSDLFQVNSGTSRFASSTGQNFESMTCSANPCTVTVTATDAGGNTGTQVVSVTIQDVNEFSPEFGDGATATATPNENQQAVGTYAASDADGTATQTYSILTAEQNAASVDHDLFSVASGGVLTFATAPNYESAGCGSGTTPTPAPS